MKYPQAYIFFKNGTVIDPNFLQTIVGNDAEIYLPKSVNKKVDAIENRVRIARLILENDGKEFRREPSVAVLNVSELNTFFAIKYLDSIEGIVWIKSASDFAKLRSSVAAFNRFWLFMRGLYLSTNYYRKIAKNLGHECSEFLRDDELFASLSDHKNLLVYKEVIASMTKRLNAMACVGQFQP